MTAFEKRPLKRMRYWQGQMLRSADFRAQNADTAQHRWWHNRALHNAYGVYQGLGVSATLSNAFELTSVSVAAGVGYDCFGRELILDEAQTVALPTNVPPGPVFMVLVISYEVADDCQAPVTQEICWTSARTQTGGTVGFRWIPLNRVKLSCGVPIGQVAYDGEGGRKLDRNFVPPGARPITRPAIATGVTLPQTTAWERWEPWPLQNATVGVQADIDTSAAGFTETPCYFAWLKGSLFNANTGQLLPDMFSSLANESPNGFTFRMWFPPPPIQIQIQQVAVGKGALAASSRGVNVISNVISNPNDFFPFARQQRLYVQWVASQMPPTVPFVPLRLRILNEWLLPLVLKRMPPMLSDIVK